ncbi:MAG: EAL domain-containing protein [Oscillospiraceae bacterium]
MASDDDMQNGKKHKETLLVVDDVEMNRDILKGIFTDFNILEAADGEEALATLRAHKGGISLMLLDIIMPGKDGLEVLREMRTDDDLSAIPVIITSASDELRYGLRAIELGAMDFVTKPVEPALVRLRVASALQKRDNERLRVQSQYLLLQREEELRHQKELRRLAERDSLTGLYNKNAFFRQVQQLLAENPDNEYVLIAFDVERFKLINELFGFHEGDRLLCYIADRMKANALPSELFCRLESDNYAMCTRHHQPRIEQILADIPRETAAYKLAFDVKIIVGCYVVRDKDLSVEAMLDRALMAKRTIKGRFQKQCAFYDDELRLELLREQRIENEMESALADGQFKMYLQAQYNYATGEIIGAEALVRWLHPEKGLIPPCDFIPIFERNGFIRRLDESIWEQACISIRRWMDHGYRSVPLHISVNISRMDIYTDGLCEAICALTEKYNVPPQSLKLEITESAYVQNPALLIDMADTLRARGFCLEIDDFGSGYSSLNTLKDLQVDVLKLDMKFLEDNSRSQRSDSILFHVINMAKSLGLAVIAEGVETKEQADFLLSLGCELMQGYYFAKPVPIVEFERLLGRE